MHAQKLPSVEVGLGVGNFPNHRYSLGKGEVGLGLFKRLSKGRIGADFSLGGDLLWGDPGVEVINGRERIDAYATRFTSLLVSYGHYFPVNSKFVWEASVGYSSLYNYVHAQNVRKVQRSNISYALGVGYSFGEFSCKLRYQYYGHTASFEGIKSGVETFQKKTPISMVMFRLSRVIDLN